VTGTGGAPLRAWNATAFGADEITPMPVEALGAALARRVSEAWRLVALFGIPRERLPLPLVALLSHPDGGWLEVLGTEVGQAYPSFTPSCPQAARFEREVCEQFGVRPAGHPWLKPVRGEASWGPGPVEPHPRGAEIGVGYPFFSMEGSGVHEVAVGPVHAGVIEPGHFRFQCHGEVVHHLEIVLGYQHRGVERALLGGPHRATVQQIEELSGDATVAHATAYCEVREALAAQVVPPRGQALRALALELERMACHTGDLGALAGDVGFLPTAAYCGRLRGVFLDLTAELCGNRFGRGFVRPGGVTRDLADGDARRMLETLRTAEPELRSAVELFFSSGSVLARVEQVGVVSREDALALGLVGVAARACGLSVDARQDHPSGLYRVSHIPVATSSGGDVHARAVVRWLEVQRSLDFVRRVLRELPSGPVRTPEKPPRPDAAAFSLVEGWRGEVVHVAVTGRSGSFERYKVVDPSFRNWPGLELAVRGQQVSDFPLCNKSFNLSYSGHDL